MKHLLYTVQAVAFLFLPAQVFAQAPSISTGPINNANDLIKRLTNIGDVVVFVLIALAVIYIVYATVQYFIKGADGDDRSAAGMKILWGIVGLFIIVSLWGLVALLVNTFPTGQNQAPTDRFPKASFTDNGYNAGSSGGLIDAPQGYGSQYSNTI
jgi:hypothetical protein